MTHCWCNLADSLYHFIVTIIVIVFCIILLNMAFLLRVEVSGNKNDAFQPRNFRVNEKWDRLKVQRLGNRQLIAQSLEWQARIKFNGDVYRPRVEERKNRWKPVQPSGSASFSRGPRLPANRSIASGLTLRITSRRPRHPSPVSSVAFHCSRRSRGISPWLLAAGNSDLKCPRGISPRSSSDRRCKERPSKTRGTRARALIVFFIVAGLTRRSVRLEN